MSTRYRVRHRTTYRYSERMTRGHTLTHLVPRSDGGQSLESFSLSIDPEPGDRFEYDDAFGNRVVQFVVARAHAELIIESESTVQTSLSVLPDDPGAWDTQRTWSPEVAGFVAPSPFALPTDAVREFAAESFVPGRTIPDVALDLSRRINAEFTFDPSFSEIATPVDEVIRARRGVCQDFAHLAIASLRSFGLPARYVSGYLETFPPPGYPKLVGADASHAWCSVALGGGGWLDLDPTNDQVPPRHHIVTAYGRDYLDVSPVLGVVVGPVATQQLEVAVDVVRLDPA